MIATEQNREHSLGHESLRKLGLFARFVQSPWAVVMLLAVALFLRTYKADTWSLWEDEETSIFFSQQLDKPFPKFFPLFFQILHTLYEITGVSVASGRYACALLGFLSVWLTYVCTCRIASRQVALIAAFLLSVNLGHLYWSQSIRYFIGLFSLQLLSFYWFLNGMEHGKIRLLFLSNLAFFLCLRIHFSALLMTPVFIAYIFLMICGKQKGGAYNLRGYLCFGLPHVVLLALCAWNIAQAQRFMSGAPSPIARDPIHVLITSASYFGIPILFLALLSPMVSRLVPGRVLLFLLLAGFLPLLELVVIAALKLSNVTWYNAFFSLASLVMLAAMTLVSLWEHGVRRIGLLGGGVAVAWSATLLLGYYTIMHGDRPRWIDAASYLRAESNFNFASNSNPKIFATVPGVVAYYLGVPPAETMGSPLVRAVPERPPSVEQKTDQWYVVENGNVTPEVASWLEKFCTLKATFGAWTGPRDRSIRVYYRGADASGKRVVEASDRSLSRQGNP